MIVDLALSATGSQLIASVLPTVRHCCTSPSLLSSFSGRQGAARYSLRVHQGSHRHSSWLQDRIQGHLAFVSGCSSLLFVTEHAAATECAHITAIRKCIIFISTYPPSIFTRTTSLTTTISKRPLQKFAPISEPNHHHVSLILHAHSLDHTVHIFFDPLASCSAIHCLLSVCFLMHKVITLISSVPFRLSYIWRRNMSLGR